MKREKFYILEIFRSNYFKLVFILSLVISYFVIPKNIFYGFYTVLGIIFMITFSLVLTCLIKDIKDRIVLAKTYRHHLLGILATAVGLTALHACTIGAPVCASAILFSFIFALLPPIFLNLLTKYAPLIVVLSIIMQLIILYFLGCFKKN